MKKLLLHSLVILAGLAVVSKANSQGADAVKLALPVSNIIVEKGMIDEEIADFLVVSANTKMADAQQAHIAAKKSSNKAIREYARMVEKEQLNMLRKIQSIAAARKIELPENISAKKQGVSEELNEKAGVEFDKIFLKTMKTDHEKDLKLFKQAARCSDRGVVNFAVQSLPVIQNQLDTANEIQVAP